MSTKEKIQNTINRLREKENWEDFKKDYEYGKLISHFNVERIINDSLKKKEEEEKEAAKNKKNEEEKKRLEELKESIMNGTVTELDEDDYIKIAKQSGDGPRQFWIINWVLDEENQKYKYKETNPSKSVAGWEQGH